MDLFLIEADYASKYVKSDNSIDVKKTVGLTDEDLKQQYDYTKKIVSENGIQKGVTWQATPGLFAYRRSIAKKVLGTDDPDQVQKQLKDWDKFDQIAQKMNAAGYKMHWQTVVNPQKKEMEFTEIMPCVKVHMHITGAVHGCVRRREPIIFLLSGI